MSLPKLPSEILSHVLRFFAEELADWEDSRKHLQLRLVSTQFGSSFERAIFKDIRVEIDSSLSSTSNHLLMLLRTNRELAREVHSLSMSDDKAFSNIVSGAFGGPGNFLDTLRRHGAEDHEQIASFAEACGELRVLNISSTNIYNQTPVISPVFCNLPKLQTVCLQCAAFAKYFNNFMRLNRSDVSLVVSPPPSIWNGTGAPEYFMGRLAAAWTQSPLTLESLWLDTLDVEFLAWFVALIPIRPRTLCLRLRDTAQLSAAVDAVIQGPMLGTMEAVSFWFPALEKDEVTEASSDDDPAEQLSRLQAAALPGCKVSMHIE